MNIVLILILFYVFLCILCIYNRIYANERDMMGVFNKYIKEIRKQGRRCFTLQQVTTELNTSYASARFGIHRLKQEGDIISPAKGFYVIVPPEYQRQKTIPPEELIPLLMEHLQQDYYVGLLSAARFYGATHQRSNCFQVISNKRMQKPLIFGSIEIDFIYKKAFDNIPLNKVVVSSGYLEVASPELVIYDLLHYSIRSGGLNHSATIFSEMIESVDSSKLIELAILMNEKSWLQRLGYILDHIETEDEQKKGSITEAISEYLNGKIKEYVPLEPGISRKEYPRNKRWKIIENTKIESDL